MGTRNSTKYVNGRLYLTSKAVQILLGITTGQLNGANTRGDLNPIQPGGSDTQYLYDPAEVLHVQRQVWTEGRLGDANLRKKPVIKNEAHYRITIKKLVRDGFAENEFVLEALPDKGFMLVDPAQQKVPDTLPFTFQQGSEGLLPEAAKARFSEVNGCFGYADETNTECNQQCEFFAACCAARFSVLEAIARAKEEGKAYENFARRAQMAEIRKAQQLLKVPLQEA